MIIESDTEKRKKIRPESAIIPRGARREVRILGMNRNLKSERDKMSSAVIEKILNVKISVKIVISEAHEYGE